LSRLHTARKFRLLLFAGDPMLSRLLNVPAMWRYVRAHRGERSIWDPANDLELALYATVFGNNFLHYGYFPNLPVDPETISLATVRQAMNDYASLLVERVKPSERALDVGCGMGGLLARLSSVGVRITGLTPNNAQTAHIRSNWPEIPVVNDTLEGAAAKGLVRPDYDVLINAESFQYIDIDAGMTAVRNAFASDAVDPRWLCIDYFRLNPGARNKSGHLLTDFESGLRRHGFSVREQVDVTENVLPSLAYGRMLAKRLALPLLRFSVDKFFLRRPLLSYLFHDWTRGKLDSIRLDTLDPDVFRREKRYLLFTLVPQ
jgi:SAM-dependent methyltransferase